MFGLFRSQKYRRTTVPEIRGEDPYIETIGTQRLRLLPIRQLRQFEGNSASPDPAVPVRILREVLLVIVGAVAVSYTKIARLRRRGRPAGRFSIDVDVNASVDHRLLAAMSVMTYTAVRESERQAAGLASRRG